MKVALTNQTTHAPNVSLKLLQCQQRTASAAISSSMRLQLVIWGELGKLPLCEIEMMLLLAVGWCSWWWTASLGREYRKIIAFPLLLFNVTFHASVVGPFPVNIQSTLKTGFHVYTTNTGNHPYPACTKTNHKKTGKIFRPASTLSFLDLEPEPKKGREGEQNWRQRDKGRWSHNRQCQVPTKDCSYTATQNKPIELL